MSWYNTPISPIDPVVVSQQPKPPFRYIRDNFTNTGQNSYMKPPAQDQSMWQSLLNVQPITQGILNQRWGYTSFTGLANTPNRLYNFQSDALGTRTIISAGLKGIRGFNEDGTIYNPNIFSPSASSGIIRSVTSRNFQYFCDGLNALNTATHQTGDSLKWNGAASGGVSNIGILTTDVTINGPGGPAGGNTMGPNSGTTATDLSSGGGTVWTNPIGIYSTTIASSASTHSSTPITDYIQALKFFNSAAGNGVAGIQVSIQYNAIVDDNELPPEKGWFQVNLVKNGVGVGSTRLVQLTIDGNTHTANFGSASDLWGTSFSLSDLVSPNFGFNVTVRTYGGGTRLSLFSIKAWNAFMTVTFTDATGTSSSSGTGVGIIGATPGGAINLTIGRKYYLVANTATVGHFSDLSVASPSTGASTNTEFNLLLATYNDPQVDTKYILATPDGGDPSILYEVQVLIPGFTVTSWVIAANVVTFTGVYTSPQFAIGATTIIGGLVHGFYMNGTTMTVTASTATTFSAAFTHANDSATETGIAGSNTFAIPNNVTQVVDNTPDPSLALNQPLVYTDIFGNEFGLTLNTPPPAGNLLVKHQGRLWMAGVPGATHSVFFSKSGAELTLPDGFVAGKYEEAWPGSNYFDISDGAESVAGFLSDGTTLYIGTQNHVRRLLGNSPFNFQEPQIIHPEVGLINQEVWQLTFMQGAPSGSIWMTPDFRVIQSDFNTYVDIGTPIQDILNNLKSTAATLAHAAFVADGEYELYILSVPYKQSSYCDTQLVFDLHSRHWVVWQPAGGSLSMKFNITQTGVPQWLFINGIADHINIYDPNATSDQGTTIPITATTTWMHLGEPTRRKLLNEIQVHGNTAMTMSVYGSNNEIDFLKSPRPVVYNRTLRQSPFGMWTLYLTGAASKYRYYQITFNASNGQVPFLGTYAISAIPMDDV